jgi:hypothetical protein
MFLDKLGSFSGPIQVFGPDKIEASTSPLKPTFTHISIQKMDEQP